MSFFRKKNGEKKGHKELFVIFRIFNNCHSCIKESEWSPILKQRQPHQGVAPGHPLPSKTENTNREELGWKKSAHDTQSVQHQYLYLDCWRSSEKGLSFFLDSELSKGTKHKQPIEI